MRSVMTQYDPMGLAVVEPNHQVNLYSSNQPYAHIEQAKNMEQIVQNYISSEEGQKLLAYFQSKNRKIMKIKGVGAGDLGENTVAALLHNDLEGVILANYNGKTFESRVGEMAQKYGVDSQSATEYVLAHELAHAAGYKTELEVESFLNNYFQTQAFQSQGEKREKYVQLAGLAAQRIKEIKKN